MISPVSTYALTKLYNSNAIKFWRQKAPLYVHYWAQVKLVILVPRYLN